MAGAPMRVAMWSGPRNISTAMMRCFGSRADTVVADEPFYARWLLESGKQHPGRAEILAAHESDVDAITRQLLAPLPEGKTFFYQKHMAHHMLNIALGDWMDALCHVFLIRDPRRMLASYIKKHDIDMTPETLGLPQLDALYDTISDRYGKPLIITTEAILSNPEKALSALCDCIGLEFDPAMLRWEPGLKDTDGIWATHWYDRVMQSTGFAPYDPTLPELTPALKQAADACMPYYDRLRRSADIDI